MTTRRILYRSSLAVLLGQSGITFYLPMLPDITADLAGNKDFAALTLSTFLIGMALCVLLWGRLGAAIGSNRVLAWTLCLYSCCTFLLAISSSAWEFLSLRLIQGALAGGISVAARALLVEHYEKRELTRAYSSLSLCFVLSLGASQFFGAVIAELSNWRVAFMLIAASCLLLQLIPCLKGKTQRRDLNSSTGRPSNYYSLIGQRQFIYPVLAGGFGYSIIVVFSSTAPILFQHAFNWTMWEYGLLGWPISIAYLVGTRLASKVATGDNEVTILRVSSTLLVVSALLMALTSSIWKDAAHSLWLPYCLMLVAQGVAYPASLSLASRQSTVHAAPAMALIALIHQLMAASASLLFNMQSVSISTLIGSCLILAVLAWLAARARR